MSSATSQRSRSGRPAPRMSEAAHPPTAPSAPPVPAKVEGFRQLLERAEQEVVSATFWAEDVPNANGPMVVRVRGRRLHVAGKAGPADTFVREERVDALPPRSGPFSVSIQVPGVNPGEWSISAELLPQNKAKRRSGPKRVKAKRAERGQPLAVAAWSRRRLFDAGTDSVTTTTGLGIRRPGILRGGWAAMVALALVGALVFQHLLLRQEGVPEWSALTLSLVAAFAGGVGAKAWYVFLDRKRGRWNGWCIQGFITALLAVLIVGAPMTGLPIGTFLDLSTPPLFLGMAIGRLGCLFAGCCGGRPTCSRFAVWGSDQRIGVRRLPIQLLESSLSLTISAAAYAIIVAARPAIAGIVFVSAVAVYTLFRQLLLRFRAEARRTTTGSRNTAVLATLILAGAIMLTVV